MRPLLLPKTIAHALLSVTLLVLLTGGSVANTASLARAEQPSNSATGLLSVVDVPDILVKHRLLADRTLRLLPADCRDHLTSFFVRYDHPERRGYGGRTSIILDGTVPDEEFVALLAHECGHIIHENLNGSPTHKWSGFSDGSQRFYADSPIPSFFSISWQTERVMRRGAATNDFASGYGRTDAFEDFAEFFTEYMLHPQLLEARAKDNVAIHRKLTWMQRMFPHPATIATSLTRWNGTVPWDATKLALQLLPANSNVLAAIVR